MLVQKSLLALALAALIQPSCSAQPAGLSATPNTVSPGQTITLAWLVTGDKAILSGGRFGNGTDVTSRKSATDAPRMTTRYAIVVSNRTHNSHMSAKTGTAETRLRYEVVVKVERTPAETLNVYQGSQGWQVKYPSAWRCDSVNLPDPVNNGLIFFQQEQDSVERLAVSVLPARYAGSDGLIKEVRDSTYASYGEVRIVTQAATTHAGVTAAWLEFSGRDVSHPGVTTRSMVLAFVKGSRAYVISARTHASKFHARESELKKLIRSFEITGKQVETPDIRLAERGPSYLSYL